MLTSTPTQAAKMLKSDTKICWLILKIPSCSTYLKIEFLEKQEVQFIFAVKLPVKKLSYGGENGLMREKGPYIKRKKFVKKQQKIPKEQGRVNVDGGGWAC